jgi:hypothetical protein
MGEEFNTENTKRRKYRIQGEEMIPRKTSAPQQTPRIAKAHRICVAEKWKERLVAIP